MRSLEGQVMEHAALAEASPHRPAAARAGVLRNLRLSSSGDNENGLTVYDMREATTMASLAR